MSFQLLGFDDPASQNDSDSDSDDMTVTATAQATQGVTLLVAKGACTSRAPYWDTINLKIPG